MDDNRIKWIKKLVYTGLGLVDDSLFTELLERDEHQSEKLLKKFLDNTADSSSLYSSALIFYSIVSEVTREVEIEEGTFIYNYICVFLISLCIYDRIIQ